MPQCTTHGLAAGPNGQCVLCRREAGSAGSSPDSFVDAPATPRRSLVSRIPAILGICVMLGMFYCAWWWATASQEDKIALFGASEAPEDPYAANLTVKQMLREVVAASCEVALACNARGFKKAFPGGLEQCQQQPLPKLPASAQDVDFDAHVRCDNVGLDQCLSSLANRSCKTAPDAGMPDACVKCLATVPNKQR